MLTGTPLDYQELRLISPEAARRAILQVLQSCNGDVAKTARALRTSRPTIYKALRKKESGSLADTSRAPHTIHNKTAEGSNRITAMNGGAFTPTHDLL